MTYHSPMPICGSPLVRSLRVAVGLGSLLAALLVGVGLMVFPAALTEWKATLPGLAGVGLALGLYTWLGVWGTARLDRTDPQLLRLALGFGLAADAIYTVEILLEYKLVPSDNTRYGYVEFGLVFLCYLLCGFVAGFETRRVGNGPLVAAGAAVISTLIWYIVLLGATYAMKGTPQQAAVFRAEGNLEDFARSGSTNFEAWLMQDFLGAGFYHLLLGLAVASLLGTVGGLLGRYFPWKLKESAIRD